MKKFILAAAVASMLAGCANTGPMMLGAKPKSETYQSVTNRWPTWAQAAFGRGVDGGAGIAGDVGGSSSAGDSSRR